MNEAPSLPVTANVYVPALRFTVLETALAKDVFSKLKPIPVPNTA